jgi:hypothetical protein
MKKINWIILGSIAILAVTGLFVSQKITDNDTYEGMSIIPEQHDDIPLFDGLELTDHEYVIEGNHWKDIYDFYIKELPKHGWKEEYKGTALEDDKAENDWGGFYSRWRKEGFDGELEISAHYNQFEEQTEVIFDKTPIYNSTTWIDNVPDSICVYENLTDKKCVEIKDQNKIKEIVRFINDAIDWNEKLMSREKKSVIDFGNLNVQVLYENDKEIYFQSEKGTKLMKPDPGFFKLTSLPR